MTSATGRETHRQPSRFPAAYTTTLQPELFKVPAPQMAGLPLKRKGLKGI